MQVQVTIHTKIDAELVEILVNYLGWQQIAGETPDAVRLQSPHDVVPMLELVEGGTRPVGNGGLHIEVDDAEATSIALINAQLPIHVKEDRPPGRALLTVTNPDDDLLVGFFSSANPYWTVAGKRFAMICQVNDLDGEIERLGDEGWKQVRTWEHSGSRGIYVMPNNEEVRITLDLCSVNAPLNIGPGVVAHATNTSGLTYDLVAVSGSAKQ